MFSQPELSPSIPIHGSLEEISSSGMAMVSNGTIRVARMIVRMTSLPRQFRNTKLKAAIKQISSDRMTVVPVTMIEFITNKATGARSNASK